MEDANRLLNQDERENQNVLAPKTNTTLLPTGQCPNQVDTTCTNPQISATVCQPADCPNAPDNTDIPATKPSYASFLRPKAVLPTIPFTQLPTPYKKGNMMAVKIDENVYQASLRQCQYNLHGRLILKRGKPPIKAMDLHLLLSNVWNIREQWSPTPIGKGYYTIRFANAEDKQKVWSAGQVNLREGSFNLFQWSREFKPSQQKQTRAHVWARLYEVPEEYLHHHLILSMANVIGFPVSIDPFTLKKDFGHYCRVEVDVDLKGELPTSILVEREGYNFEIEISYEKIPELCAHCSVIGYLVTECRTLKRAQQQQEQTSKPPVKPHTKHKPPINKSAHKDPQPSSNHCPVDRPPNPSNINLQPVATPPPSKNNHHDAVNVPVQSSNAQTNNNPTFSQNTEHSPEAQNASPNTSLIIDKPLQPLNSVSHAPTFRINVHRISSAEKDFRWQISCFAQPISCFKCFDTWNLKSQFYGVNKSPKIKEILRDINGFKTVTISSKTTICTILSGLICCLYSTLYNGSLPTNNQASFAYADPQKGSCRFTVHSSNSTDYRLFDVVIQL
ncbi:hypothetical protein LguiA_011262 [Lonicera macranthoides]